MVAHYLLRYWLSYPNPPPVMKAVIGGNIDHITAVLDQGEDVNAMGIDDVSALHVAATMSHKSIVRLLILRNADVNARNVDSWPPLYFAAREGHVEAMKELMSHGAQGEMVMDDNLLDPYSALHVAAWCDKLPACLFCIESGLEWCVTFEKEYAKYEPRLSRREEANKIQQIRRAWENGPHPSQVKRRLFLDQRKKGHFYL